MVRQGRPLPKALSLDQVRQLFAQIHHPMDKVWFDRIRGFLAAFGDSSEEIYYMQRTPTTSERRSAALT